MSLCMLYTPSTLLELDIRRGGREGYEMRKFKMSAVVTVLVCLGLATPTPTLAAPTKEAHVVWVESHDDGSPVITATKSSGGATVAATLAATYCRTFTYTQKAIDFPSGATLAWHKMTISFCYNGSAIVGTPYITYHDADSTAYGTSLGVYFHVGGISGPYPLSGYQWTSTGYATYGQCVPYVGPCFRSQSRHITLNPQGSGGVGYSAG